VLLDTGAFLSEHPLAILNVSVSGALPEPESLVDAGKRQMTALINKLQEHDALGHLFFRASNADNSVKITSMLFNGVLSSPKYDVGPHADMDQVWLHLLESHARGQDREQERCRLEREHLEASNLPPVEPPLRYPSAGLPT